MAWAMLLLVVASVLAACVVTVVVWAFVTAHKRRSLSRSTYRQAEQVSALQTSLASIDVAGTALRARVGDFATSLGAGLLNVSQSAAVVDAALAQLKTFTLRLDPGLVTTISELKADSAELRSSLEGASTSVADTKRRMLDLQELMAATAPAVTAETPQLARDQAQLVQTVHQQAIQIADRLRATVGQASALMTELDAAVADKVHKNDLMTTSSAWRDAWMGMVAQVDAIAVDFAPSIDALMTKLSDVLPGMDVAGLQTRLNNVPRASTSADARELCLEDVCVPMDKLVNLAAPKQ